MVRQYAVRSAIDPSANGLPAASASSYSFTCIPPGAQAGELVLVISAACAPGNSPQNVYIQSATLNGKPFTRTYLTHTQLLAGGTLNLTMGPKPNTLWGTAAGDLPPVALNR